MYFSLTRYTASFRDAIHIVIVGIAGGNADGKYFWKSATPCDDVTGKDEPKLKLCPFLSLLFFSSSTRRAVVPYRQPQ